MRSKKTLTDVLFKEKPFKILLVLSDGIPKNITQIYKGVKTTYSHTLNILKNFYDLGLIEFEKAGREKVVKLSKKGEKIIEIIKKFLILSE